MAGKKSDLGPIGVNLTHNLSRLRGDLSYAELSRKLSDMGREIPPLGLRRIESGQRRVDADDLVALAAALDVSPISLLMPSAATGEELVEVTGVDSGVEARRLWRWLVADMPLTGNTAQAMVGFLYRSIPGWLFGDQIDLVESGVEPNITRIVRRYGSEQILRERTDGDD